MKALKSRFGFSTLAMSLVTTCLILIPVSFGQTPDQFLEKQRLVRQQHLINGPAGSDTGRRDRSQLNQALPLASESESVNADTSTPDRNRPYLQGNAFTPINLRPQVSAVQADTQGVVAQTAGDPPRTEVNTNITTNVIWQASNVYHVTGTVNVQALLVIEPGTVVTFGQNAVLKVNNGGCLVAVGAPDRLITFISDLPYYGYYGSPCYIEPTASVSCKISFCLIQGAAMGVYTQDIRLDEPIQNNFLYYCVYGSPRTERS